MLSPSIVKLNEIGEIHSLKDKFVTSNFNSHWDCKYCCIYSVRKQNLYLLNTGSAHYGCPFIAPKDRGE